jgi:hypothetical protein
MRTLNNIFYDDRTKSFYTERERTTTTASHTTHQMEYNLTTFSHITITSEGEKQKSRTPFQTFLRKIL